MKYMGNTKEVLTIYGEIKNITELKATYSYVYRYLTNYDNEIHDNITSDEKDSFLDYLHKKHKVYFL